MSAVIDIQRVVLGVRNMLREDQIIGMKCMRHVCVYIVARYMTIDRAVAIGLPIKYAWESIMDLYEHDDGAQLAYDMFHDSNNPDNIMSQFDRLFGTIDFIFSVSSPESHKKIMTIMNRINIDTVECEIDLLGWVYEQHLKTGATVARDLGQYFTNRSICKYMIELCDPHIKEDGTMETICDPTMGTGGFITTAIKHYEANAHVDWCACIDAIHGCDSDREVVAIAQMNMFMETKGMRARNVLLRNSLYDGLPKRKYDVIVANPPFGLKNIVYDQCCAAIRCFDIRSKKSEPLFLQLVMASLAQGGRAAIILPTAFLDGVGAPFINTRKQLITDFHVTRIIHISSNTFMNTKAGTSIITFSNDEYSTGDIEVIRITSDRAQHGDIHETIIGTISREDIEQSGDFSLDLGRYTMQFLVTDPSMSDHAMHLSRIHTINDVCYLIPGTQVSAKSFIYDELAVIKQANMSSGQLVLTDEQEYAARNTPKKHARPMLDDIVISTAYDCGCCARVTTTGWVISCDTYILRARDRAFINPQYLFWCIYSGGFYEMMQTLQRGTGVQHIRKDDIRNAPIYVPPMEEQLTIIDRLNARAARKDEIRAQISILRQEMTQLQISARHDLNPLFDDTHVDPPSQSRAKRDIFPHMY